MKTSPLFFLPRRDRGVALVLVLCFVVLITGLVVAYFSRTLTTRQLAGASTSGTQAEMLANSATDVILGDLKQEIADPGASFTPSPAVPSGVNVYLPTKAAYAVPQRNTTPAVTASGGPIPNLVRRSLRGDATGGANPLPTPAPSSRASAANSATLSANGRAVTPTRWNRHYLIPTAAAGGTISVTAGAPVADFTAPDWVFVTGEKGPAVLSSPTKDASGNAVTVNGRYAYAIYDEGGLLDSNYTGFPSVSTTTTTGIGHIGGKPAPGYADLTQLGMTTANVDNLLGWRNYASLQISTSAFPTFTPLPTSADAAFYNLSVSKTGNSFQVPTTVWNNKTDQRFLSRQQLINYVAAAGLDTKYLQYLGTFSRGLNQPSYLPEHSATSLTAIRPPVLAPASGGNDSSGNTGITPDFLAARVVNAFAPPNTRYDGTPVVIGEPLLKKRFPLNRLAWLTYKGPSAGRSTTDADMAAMINAGITPEFLQQGTAANIATYFGLTWNASSKWTYSHGATGILNVYNPTKDTDVTRQTPGREPDFFELLKASINPGSIAKISISPSIVDPTTLATTHAAQNQYQQDVSLDIAILQIGANIIDQFDTDGFPTQINYTNLGPAGKSGSVYGDENVPYISRVRSGLIHLVESQPVETNVNPVDGSGQPVPITNTGVAALMNYPEIWNMHDWSSTAVSQSVGTVAPVHFKIFAKTNDNDLPFRQATTVYVWNNDKDSNGNLNSKNSCDADWNSTPSKSPGFHDQYHFEFGAYSGGVHPKGGEPRYLAEGNTMMTFVVDPTASTANGALFREPTILYLPNIPTGSQLAAPYLIAGPDDPNGLGHLALNTTFFGSPSGLKSAVQSTSSYNTTVPKLNASYIGFYIGAHPLRFWWDNNSPTYAMPTNSSAYQTQFGPVNDVIYCLACEDGNGGWLQYDNKPLTAGEGIDGGGQPNGHLQEKVDTGFGFNSTPDYDFGVRFYQTLDPRTSRFGMLQPWIQANTNSIPPRQNYAAISMAQGTIKPDREGANAGTALFLNYTTTPSFGSAMGWYPGNVLYGDNWFRPGLLAQNNPYANSDGIVIAAGGGITPWPGSAGNSSSAFYYSDADGVVRRAMSGNVDVGAGSPPPPASSVTGLPMAWAKGTTAANSSGTPAAGTDYPTLRQMDSRPSILNRPFRSVAELGYVYSGTPWKNLDFFLPESGDAAMLDVFCINDNSDINAMTAGQVNLNTRQVPVLQAILAQASKDQWNEGRSSFAITGTAASGQAQQLAQLLVARTTTGPTTGPNAGSAQPLQNVSDLVGRWVTQSPLPFGGIDGKKSYDGFATDLATASGDLPVRNIQRFGESPMRALSNAGQTRVWNLMFDIVAQTGRFGTQATSLDQFNVEGEQHYWVHVAIDRYTGQILDKQVEVVKE